MLNVYPRPTAHAAFRMAQRGIDEKLAALVTAHGDIEIPSHQGCRTLMLSDAAIQMLIDEDIAPLGLLSRARSVCLIIGGDDRLVTAYRINPDRRHSSIRARRRPHPRRR